MRRAAATVVALGLLTATGEAVAQPVSRAPRIIHVPTADLQGAGRSYLTAGVSHRGEPFAALSLGLGEVAEVDLEATDKLAACPACSPADPHATTLLALTALFKIGVAEGRLGRWQPALALGFRTVIEDRQIDPAGDRGRAARLYLGASKRLGPVRAHLGLDLWDAQVVAADSEESPPPLHQGPARAQVRPFAGIAWNPSIYPRTTLIADFSYAPVLAPQEVELRWLAGWGVRYRVVSWGSIELAMRHRGGDDLSDSTVLVRVNGAFPSPL